MALSVEEQAAGAVDVILKDGGTLRLRPPSAADEDAVLAFLEGLSERSLVWSGGSISSSQLPIMSKSGFW